MKDWREKFLTNLRRTGNVTIAARSARISRTECYNLRNDDTGFEALWLDALEQAGDLLEEEARRRAYTGTLKPVYQGGDKVGEIREYSDTLLIFLLKGVKPAKYREHHRVEVSGPGGGPIPITEIVVERHAQPEEE